MKLEVGQIVKGNSRAGLAQGDVGVVVAVDLKPPRNIKVKFVKRGYWLITPQELCQPLEHDLVIISDDFIKHALNNNVKPPSREYLISLLEESLIHIEDDNLTNRINDVLSKSRI
ncbi:hypothetical protein ACFX2S_05650 [Gilliamella apicola]|uniref:hypothetical protein n=1 Tax=Gilliamella apicola TaxID=1196095 RepID=UPI003987A584